MEALRFDQQTLQTSLNTFGSLVFSITMYKLFITLASLLSTAAFVAASPVANPQGLAILDSVLGGSAAGADPGATGSTGSTGSSGSAGGPLSDVLGPSDPLAGLGV
ncbi:hypothetical protein SCHPADRAFT_944528 [Schizopora paradoxa]|uniref:Uncharacterized protein n=1 Tax=Schizopora paradoxa TaxID=27342 RepID=A0A0H2R908_9AGAM|nr:hypothetical protein SCHPADRAFT_944528 [Schizopora paradoxa]